MRLVAGTRLARLHYNSVQEYCKGAADMYGVPYEIGQLENVRIDGIAYGGQDDVIAGINLLRSGCLDGSELVERYMNQVMQNLPTFSRQWYSDVAGYIANVPAFLAGDPASMWNIHSEQSDNTPLRIWVNILPSSANNAKQVQMRGAAICALALVLQQKRSVVRISPYADLGMGQTETGSIISYDLTMPLSTSELLAAVANNVTRKMSMAMGQRTNYTGSGWVLGHQPNTSYYSDALCKKHLEAGPDDIVVPAIHAHDTLLDDPIAWIHKRLEPYMTGEVYR